MGFTGWPAVAKESPIYADEWELCGWNQLVGAINERILALNDSYDMDLAWPLTPVVKSTPPYVEYMRELRSSVELLLNYYRDPDNGNSWMASIGKAGFLTRFIGQPDWTDPVLVGKREEVLPGSPATKIYATHVNEIWQAVKALLWLQYTGGVSQYRYDRDGTDVFYSGFDWDGSWERAKTYFNAAGYSLIPGGAYVSLRGIRYWDVPSYPPSKKNTIHSSTYRRLVFPANGLSFAGIPPAATKLKLRYTKWNEGGEPTPAVTIHDRGSMGGAAFTHYVTIPAPGTYYTGLFDSGAPDPVAPEFSLEPEVPANLDELKPAVPPAQYTQRTRGFYFEYQGLYVRPEFAYV